VKIFYRYAHQHFDAVLSLKFSWCK